MPSYAERIAIHEKAERTIKYATTYLRKARDALYWSRQNPDYSVDRTRPISSSYWTLLDTALETSLDIVEELPDDFFEDRTLGDPFGLSSLLDVDPSDRYSQSDEPLEQAEKLVAALRARRERTLLRRTVLKLENTTGRTPEEAEAYRAKAAELRARHGLGG